MLDREELLDEILESAVENEMKYFGCSQAVLGALQENFGEVSAQSNLHARAHRTHLK